MTKPSAFTEEAVMEPADIVAFVRLSATPAERRIAWALARWQSQFLGVVEIDDSDSPWDYLEGAGLVLVDATAGDVTVNLPAAGDWIGLVVHIKRVDASGNTVTVDPDGAETIDGAATASISATPPATAQWENLTVASTGTGWVIL